MLLILTVILTSYMQNYTQYLQLTSVILQPNADRHQRKALTNKKHSDQNKN